MKIVNMVEITSYAREMDRKPVKKEFLILNLDNHERQYEHK